MRPRIIGIKALASATSIGFGGSCGREGPIVQIGSAIGSVLGRAARAPAPVVRTLVACGAAAGISATFNAPIGGVFFASEVILGDFAPRSFAVIVVSSVLAAVISRAYLGNRPSFAAAGFPTHVAARARVLRATRRRAFAAVGVGIRAPSVRNRRHGRETQTALPDRRSDRLRFCRSDRDLLPRRSRRRLRCDSTHARRPHVGRLRDGARVSEAARDIAHARVRWKRWRVRAVALRRRAMVGNAFGSVVHGAFPSWTAAAPAYALVAMAAAFAAASEAPITAIVIVFEMSGDYTIVLPLMISTVISSLLGSAGSSARRSTR